MQDYELQYLPQFYKDLDHASDYISLKLQNPQAAVQLIKDISEAITARLPYAESFEEYHSRKERRYPYYRIYVHNYTVFYVVKSDGPHKIMEVRRLLHDRQNIRKLI